MLLEKAKESTGSPLTNIPRPIPCSKQYLSNTHKILSRPLSLSPVVVVVSENFTGSLRSKSNMFRLRFSVERTTGHTTVSTIVSCWVFLAHRVFLFSPLTYSVIWSRSRVWKELPPPVIPSSRSVLCALLLLMYTYGIYIRSGDLRDVRSWKEEIYKYIPFIYSAVSRHSWMSFHLVKIRQ